ncbi:tRNA pseudouridine(55) synthase TruB [Bifidobacterium xylocopae]|uniref:tRNA pseudouridine synthase B n=1 Tax=Bifidobacterium xylocopae TaxID=2493119 RepID=A0A366KDW2_9BIFI|nr:tRNA pseudouridine(55) synthase TruB [Bifidobacterium xylocopae]RBP99422.1 tRNA pseudouridine(55) synthase TruB [Bifidobacterium xylocopae]
MHSGILIVDKPQGMTSHDLVAAVRSRLGLRRVGHAGTLDPMATGALIIGFGQATRLLNVIVGHDKTYETTIRLGQATDTDDADGELLAAGPGVAARVRALSRQQVEQAIREHYTGPIQQVPNAYSAIKVEGRRAYDLARQGQEVRLKARGVTISEFALLGYEPTQARDGSPVVDIRARVTCSSGTYIRALGRDLGRELGVGGHLTVLRRTRVGRFDLADPGLAPRVLTARAVDHTYTDREGRTVTRPKASLDQDRREIQSRALDLVEGARLTMPTIAVDRAQTQTLQHGGFLDLHLDGPTAAITGAQTGVQERLVSILVPRNSRQAKPSAVFALDEA